MWEIITDICLVGIMLLFVGGMDRLDEAYSLFSQLICECVYWHYVINACGVVYLMSYILCLMYVWLAEGCSGSILGEFDNLAFMEGKRCIITAVYV